VRASTKPSVIGNATNSLAVTQRASAASSPARSSAGYGGRIVPDVEDIAVLSWPAHRTDQWSRLHHQAGFLAHLPDQRLGVGLAGLDPPAGAATTAPPPAHARA
jgi:hypothetical protein